MIEDLLTKEIIGLAIQVHIALLPGLLESVYKECLYFKLVKEEFQVKKKAHSSIF
ncbi:GxxExxY protein [Pedobacter sp. Du54]|uniref:GxxExxY protein n=1 Tax=Pedobacter anseongensis TaxID=3133439 RepID=UPI0030AB81AC